MRAAFPAAICAAFPAIRAALRLYALRAAFPAAFCATISANLHQFL